MLLEPFNIDELQERILDKCDSFVNMNIWPAGEKISPTKWLNNFTSSEKEHSLYLLNSFTYFNMDMSMSLLKAAVVNLSKQITSGCSIPDILSTWRNFLANSIFVPVIGELNNITDSGALLAGHLRRELQISEDKILTVNQLFDSSFVSLLKSKKNIVFFDDFVGTGKQFVTMWNEGITKDGHVTAAVCEQVKEMKLKAYYCAMIGTEYGISKIEQKCLEVTLSFGNILNKSASPLHNDSNVWPSHLKETAAEFILTASRRAGLPESDLKGIENLGLSIAFAFTIPDATLPIFYTNNSKWKPLMERT